MADIAAANITTVFRTIGGNKIHLCLKVKGDGTGVTVPTGFSRIESHAIGNVDDTAGINYQITTAAGVVTYAGTPTINKYHFLHLWGF